MHRIILNIVVIGNFRQRNDKILVNLTYNRGNNVAVGVDRIHKEIQSTIPLVR